VAGSCCSCSSRHSCRSRAKTPTGSNCCRACRTAVISSTSMSILAGKQLQELLDAGQQAAVVVGGVDDGQGNGAVRVRQARQVELPEQVIVQGLGGAVATCRSRSRRRRLGRRGGALEGRMSSHCVSTGRSSGMPARSRLRRGSWRWRCLGVVQGARRGSSAPRSPRGFAAPPLVLVDLQHGVLFQGLLDLLLQIEGAQLQQADGLLQLWRHRQLLAELEMQSLLHTAVPFPFPSRPPSGASPQASAV
jgi:hypothetical protein